MNFTDSRAVDGFIRMCDDGWRQGWHERNGGNLSYCMTAEDREALAPFCPASQAGEWAPTGVEVPALGGAWLLITGAGKYFQNVLRSPADSVAAIELDGAGRSYRVRWGLAGGGRPSSELPTHLLCHGVKLAATGGACRVLYHCHPANLIALTYVLPLEDREFSRQLWDTMTECPMIFPSGVGVLPWMVPGGRAIALASCEKLRDCDVLVWAHHGVFCAGSDFDTTFGLTHAVEKAAEILVKIKSMVPQRPEGIGTEQLKALAAALGLPLPEAFL